MLIAWAFLLLWVLFASFNTFILGWILCARFNNWWDILNQFWIIADIFWILNAFVTNSNIILVRSINNKFTRLRFNIGTIVSSSWRKDYKHVPVWWEEILLRK